MNIGIAYGYAAGVTGAGQAIGFIDTGLDDTHEAFNDGRVILNDRSGLTFTDDTQLNHGTSIAGVAAAAKDDPVLKNPAAASTFCLRFDMKPVSLLCASAASALALDESPACAEIACEYMHVLVSAALGAQQLPDSSLCRYVHISYTTKLPSSQCSIMCGVAVEPLARSCNFIWVKTSQLLYRFGFSFLCLCIC